MATTPKPAAVDRVEITVHRSAKVLGIDDKPALELINIDGNVSVSLLPRNGGRRSPVRVADLTRAVQELSA